MTLDHANSKGKAPQTQPPKQDAEDSSTLSQRVRSSASGLLQSSLGRPSAGVTTGALASLNLKGQKGTSISASSNIGEASTSTSNSLRSTQGARGHLLTSESLRSNPAAGVNTMGDAQAEFDEFLAESPGIGNSGDGVHYAKQHMINHEADNRDGAAVVALLSDPGFSIDEEPIESETFDIDENHGTRHLPSRQDLRMREAGNRLELIPDFAVDDLDPWNDILGRYHDEVWGDMLPLVQEAREEIKVARASDEGAKLDRPAIRRLGMVLSHLKHPID